MVNDMNKQKEEMCNACVFSTLSLLKRVQDRH